MKRSLARETSNRSAIASALRAPAILVCRTAIVLALLNAGCRDEQEGGATSHAEPSQAAQSTASESGASAASADSHASTATAGRGAPPGQSGNTPALELYFGDLHVHTGWSFDAFENGVRTGPADAYRFARGEAIPHAAGGTIQLAGPPLDFLAVTDHAEYLGVATAGLRKHHPLQRQPLIQSWLGADPRIAELAAQRIRASAQARQPFPALIAADVLPPAWQEVVAIANAHDLPGSFTTFIGFEYSSNPELQNLHRNLIFRGANVPRRPFSAFDSENPEDLWRWMDAARAAGDDLIAIPHNANGSNGLMFAPTRFDGSAIDADWASLRTRNEPVAEVIQIKGQSETKPALSPGDEWADFEVVPWLTMNPNRPSHAAGSYLREALGVGLGFRETLGIDPFALGMIGSTDSHNSASPVVESDYFGKLGRADGTPQSRLEREGRGVPGAVAPLNVSAYWGAAGLAGIWAPANTRATLFDALRRRETFATSGPRIRVRFFAGFDLTPGDLHGDLDRLGREKGVPMGGELRARATAGSPQFLLAAQQDPREAPLERTQVIKVWRERGASHEQVFDVACFGGAAPDSLKHRCLHAAPGPDPSTCKVAADAGARELVASWVDPDFEAGEHALYYARVLQVPSCRWSSFDALRLGQAPPVGLPVTIQERAVTSPIWIVPTNTQSNTDAATASELAR